MKHHTNSHALIIRNGDNPIYINRKLNKYIIHFKNKHELEKYINHICKTKFKVKCKFDIVEKDYFGISYYVTLHLYKDQYTKRFIAEFCKIGDRFNDGTIFLNYVIEK